MKKHRNAVGLEDDGLEKEMITREEIYFTGKENIEGYACLVNIFMNSLQTKADYPAIINVDNVD